MTVQRRYHTADRHVTPRRVADLGDGPIAARGGLGVADASSPSAASARGNLLRHRALYRSSLSAKLLCGCVRDGSRLRWDVAVVVAGGGRRIRRTLGSRRVSISLAFRSHTVTHSGCPPRSSVAFIYLDDSVFSGAAC
jgi:hypothetical protein